MIERERDRARGARDRERTAPSEDHRHELLIVLANLRLRRSARTAHGLEPEQAHQIQERQGVQIPVAVLVREAKRAPRADLSALSCDVGPPTKRALPSPARKRYSQCHSRMSLVRHPGPWEELGPENQRRSVLPAIGLGAVSYDPAGLLNDVARDF